MSTRELFVRHAANPILTADDWPYQVNAVFNPGAATVGGGTVLLARVEDRRGISHLAVARSPDGVGGWTVDRAPLLAPDDVASEQWPRLLERVRTQLSAELARARDSAPDQQDLR